MDTPTSSQSPARRWGGARQVALRIGRKVLRYLLFLTEALKVPAYQQAMELTCEEAALRMGLAWENIAVTDQQILDFIGIDATTATTDDVTQTLRRVR
jgi:hypothetical protein